MNLEGHASLESHMGVHLKATRAKSESRGVNLEAHARRICKPREVNLTPKHRTIARLFELKAFFADFVNDADFRTAVKVTRLSAAPIRFAPVVRYCSVDDGCERGDAPLFDSGTGRPPLRRLLQGHAPEGGVGDRRLYR